MLTEEQKKKIELEDEKITTNMRQIKHRIVVFSGKGGVGKTTVSANLAFSLHALGNYTGILDADITGPNVPKMLDLKGSPAFTNNWLKPQISNGVEVISLANIIPENQPVIWRGPMRSKMINQFLGDVEWGSLDYLIADLPPGTGDEIMTIVQKMEPDLAIIVTTPQEMSLIDSARAINMAKKIEIPKIGLIENMSGLFCPDCGCKIDLLGTGGGKEQAKNMNIDYLGSLPVDIETRKLADNGKLIVLSDKTAKISQKFHTISKSIMQVLNSDPINEDTNKTERVSEEVI